MTAIQQGRDLRMVEDETFGDFDFETVGRQRSPGQLREHTVDQKGVFKLSGRHIEGNEWQRGPAAPTQLDVRATRNTEPQAREVYNSPENSGNIAGAAMVIDGGISRVIGNFALRLTKLDAPTRLFNSVSEAIEWLESLDDE